MPDKTQEQFQIFITRKGPVLVSGDKRFKVADCVMNHFIAGDDAIELGVIASETGLPKSSVFTTLESLVEKNVLGYDTSSSRKRYSLESYRILKTKEGNPSYENFILQVIADTPEPYNFYRMVFDFLAATSLKYGLDLSPLMKTLGFGFGKHVIKKIGDREESFKFLSKWYETINCCTVTLESSIPFTVRLDFIPSFIRTELAVLFAQFILASISAVYTNGQILKIESISSNGNSVTSVCKAGSLKDPEMIPTDFKYDDDADMNFKVFVTSQRTYRSVENPLGIAILDAMEEGIPISSADITKSLSGKEKKPQSSVLFYLEKMIEWGLVQDMEINGKRKFIRSSGMLYGWIPRYESTSYKPEASSELSMDNLDVAYEQMLATSIRRLSSLNVFVEPLTETLAVSMAHELCSMSSKKTIESVMSALMFKKELFNLSDTSVTSFYPFTFVRNLPKDTDGLLTRFLLVFDNMFFKSVLKEITGASFASECSEHDYESSRGYKLVFTQKAH